MTSNTTHHPTNKSVSKEEETPHPVKANPKNQPNQKQKVAHGTVNASHHRPKPPQNQLQPLTAPTIGTATMQNSDAADSPTMDLISQMIQGQEDNLREAATLSIVVWPGHASPQNIEGWGGDRSRNVNAITKAMKAAISGSNKGPCVSSHPHHINIIDKLDGTPDFKCMRINFDSRTDRNLFC